MLLKRLVVLLIFIKKSICHDPAKFVLPRDVYQDSIADVPTLLERYGYPTQRHSVTTQDGYILQLFRIRRGLSGDKGSPVLLVHGFAASSATYVLQFPNKPLSAVFYENGYDVWLLNTRGNYYSRRHVSLDPSDWKFWDYSFHEIAKYDLPAAIDYVLSINKAPKLHYVGHSQGSSSFIAMMSLRPEYNNKIKSYHAMAPAVYLKNNTDNILGLFIPMIPIVLVLSDSLHHFEITARSDEIRILAAFLCNSISPLMKYCLDAYLDDLDYFNSARIPFYLGHSPAGFSTKQAFHLAQLIASPVDRFSYYDHGTLKNWQIYNSSIPPEYDISKTTVPTFVYYGENDHYVNATGIKLLQTKLVNLVSLYRVSRATFGHPDFTFATDAIQLYNAVVNDVNSMNK